MVRELVQYQNMPMPKLYIIPQETPNAFATGRNPEHAAVAVTEGITRLLTKEELSGVLAHELSHVKNRDILIGAIAATIAGAITFLASMARWAMFFGGLGRDDDEESGPLGLVTVVIMMILAPIAALLIQMAISRSREFIADESGARMCRNPLYLARALKKLQMGAETIPLRANPETVQVTSHMFIVNPLRGKGLVSLFSTHPPMEERIRRLEEMNKGGY
jgi:heat shock protein HtpX